MRHFLLMSASISALVFAGSLPASAQMKPVIDDVKPAIEKKADEVVEAVKEVTKDAAETAKEETVKATEAVEEKAEEKVEEIKQDIKEETAKAEAPAMPPEPAKSAIKDALEKDSDVETFMELLKEAGMETVLTDTSTPHTLFVPTDEAFDDLPSGMIKDLRDPENKDKLVDLLNLHIVNGRVAPQMLDNITSEVLTTTLKRLRVVGEKGKFTVNGINVEDKVIEADDGVVYKLEKVITSEAEREALPFAPTPQPPAPGPAAETAPEAQKSDTTETSPAPAAAAPAAPESAPAEGEKAAKKAWYKFW